MSMNRALLILIVFTFSLSVYNWYDEGHLIGFAFTNFGAIAASTLTTVISYGVSRSQVIPVIPFKVAAIFSVVLSLAVYSFYALNGRAENSSTSAGQMHVVIVPIFLFAITIATLLIATITSVTIKLMARKKFNKAQQHAAARLDSL